MIRVGIFGRGRLGQAVAEAVREAPDFELVWQVGRGDICPPSVDVALDASLAEAVPSHLSWALSTGTDLVIAATGWEMPDLATRVEDRIGVLTASNFSLGVALAERLSGVLGRYAALDASIDPFLVEHHHSRKADAPSGTARTLAQAVLEGCPRLSGWRAGVPQPGELGIAVVRAGAEFGSHTVGLDAPSEQITLTHHVRSRGVFAAGALQAMRWVRGRRGVFPFSALAAEILDPLFD